MAAGLFREDLFFRLRVIPLEIPPLRERAGDVRFLGGHFPAAYAVRDGIVAPRLSKASWRLLDVYPWPGNVRELQNVIEQMVLICPGAFRAQSSAEVSGWGDSAPRVRGLTPPRAPRRGPRGPRGDCRSRVAVEPLVSCLRRPGPATAPAPRIRPGRPSSLPSLPSLPYPSPAFRSPRPALPLPAPSSAAGG